MTLEEEFFQQGISLQSQILGTSGASIGSIFCLAILLNFRALEFNEFLKTSLVKYKDMISTLNFFQLSEHKGLIPIDVIRGLVQDMLTLKYGESNKEMTLKELYSYTHKDFIIATHNTSYERGELIDHKTSPELQVWKAAAMSCAIPVLFHAVPYRGCLYSDAGVSNGLPFEAFPLEKSLVFNLFGHHTYVAQDEMSIQDFLCRFVHAYEILTMYKINAVPPHLRKRILSLKVPCLMQCAIEGFKLTDTERNKLVSIGKIGAMSLLKYKETLATHAITTYMNATHAIRADTCSRRADDTTSI